MTPASSKTQIIWLEDRVNGLEKRLEQVECYNKPIATPGPWVGLTKEERNVITDKVIGFNSCVGWEDDYAKAIEAALKEKNSR